jgi:hypothetical protein
MNIRSITEDAFRYYSLGAYTRRVPDRIVSLFTGSLKDYSPFEYLYYILSEHQLEGKVRRSILFRTNLLAAEVSVNGFRDSRAVASDEVAVECRVYSERIRTYAELWGGVRGYLDSTDGQKLPILVKVDALLEQGVCLDEAVGEDRLTTFWLTLYGAPEYMKACSMLRIHVQKCIWSGEGGVVPDYFGPWVYRELLRRERRDVD